MLEQPVLMYNKLRVGQSSNVHSNYVVSYVSSKNKVGYMSQHHRNFAVTLLVFWSNLLEQWKFSLTIHLIQYSASPSQQVFLEFLAQQYYHMYASIIIRRSKERRVGKESR